MGSFHKIPCKVDSDDVLKLEAHLEKRLPESVHMYGLLRLAKHPRFPKEVDIQIFIYRKNEEEERIIIGEADNDSFIVCIQRPNFHTTKSVITLPPQNLTPSHVEAFDSFIGWDEPQAFQCTPPRMWDTIRTLCQSRGKIVISKDGDGIPVIFYSILDKEKAKNLKVEVEDITATNPNMTLRPLKKSDVAQVVGLWKYALPHAKEVVEFCVETLPTVGVFENGELASCVTMSPLGMCNLLHTLPKYRGKGLGQFVMKWISREIASEMGIFPMAEAENANIASNKAQTNAGYEKVFYAKNYYYEPRI